MINKLIYQVPNIISLCRMIIAIWVIMLITQNHYAWSVYAMIIAIASDILDGWIARKYNLSSHWGSALDITADKILIIGFSIALWLQNQLIWWFCILLLIKELLLIFSWFIKVYVYNKPHVLQASLIGKISGFVVFIVLLINLMCAAKFNIILILNICPWQIYGYILSLILSYTALLHYYIKYW